MKYELEDVIEENIRNTLMEHIIDNLPDEFIDNDGNTINIPEEVELFKKYFEKYNLFDFNDYYINIKNTKYYFIPILVEDEEPKPIYFIDIDYITDRIFDNIDIDDAELYLFNDYGEYTSEFRDFLDFLSHYKEYMNDKEKELYNYFVNESDYYNSLNKFIINAIENKSFDFLYDEENDRWFTVDDYKEDNILEDILRMIEEYYNQTVQKNVEDFKNTFKGIYELYKKYEKIDDCDYEFKYYIYYSNDIMGFEFVIDEDIPYLSKIKDDYRMFSTKDNALGTLNVLNSNIKIFNNEIIDNYFIKDILDSLKEYNLANKLNRNGILKLTTIIC